MSSVSGDVPVPENCDGWDAGIPAVVGLLSLREVFAVPERSMTSSELRELTWGWWLAVLMGAISVVAGIVVLAKPSDSLATLAVVFGIFVLVDGIVELAGALAGGSPNRGMLAVVGVISVIAGVLLIRHPLGGVRAVALVVGIWLVAGGVVRFIAAFDAEGHRVLRIGLALVLMIAGIAIVASPHIGYSTLALIAGLGFIAYGVGMMAYGWALHTVRHAGLPLTDPDASAAT
jgi:uncharacterized membrane protein HdeD (DUF308 family)